MGFGVSVCGGVGERARVGGVSWLCVSLVLGVVCAFSFISCARVRMCVRALLGSCFWRASGGVFGVCAKGGERSPC